MLRKVVIMIIVVLMMMLMMMMMMTMTTTIMMLLLMMMVVMMMTTMSAMVKLLQPSTSDNINKPTSRVNGYNVSTTRHSESTTATKPRMILTTRRMKASINNNVNMI